MPEPVGSGPRGDIPSNSIKEREAQSQQGVEPREKLTSVVSGTVIVSKSPWYKRAARNMIADDASTIGEHILLNIFLPGVRNLIFDIVTQSAGRALYPGGRNVGSAGITGGGLGMRGVGGGIRQKYHEMGPGGDPRPQISRDSQARQDFSEITLTSREEAISVVQLMIARVEKYGQASVTDLYDLCGTTGDYTAQYYGWTNLRDANIRPHRGGWALDLPRPEKLRG